MSDSWRTKANFRWPRKSGTTSKRIAKAELETIAKGDVKPKAKPRQKGDVGPKLSMFARA